MQQSGGGAVADGCARFDVFSQQRLVQLPELPNERVVVGQPCFGQREAAGLFEEVIQHAPAGISKPSIDGVADRLTDAGRTDPGKHHAIVAGRNVPGPTIAHR